MDSRYNSVDSIREMQEAGRQYAPDDLRKDRKTRKPLRGGGRWIIDLFGLFVIRKDEGAPNTRILRYR